MTPEQTPLMRAARFVGDFGNPFYDEERHRDVWNEASAFGLQLAVVTALLFATISVWVVGRSALLYVQVGLGLVGAVGCLTILYAQRLGVDELAPQRLQRARIIPFVVLVVLVVLLVAGMLHADPASRSWSSLAGAATGGLVVAGAVVLARRRARPAQTSD